MTSNPFENLVVASRPSKPRGRGLTMIADWGMPLGQQDDLLLVSATYVDLAKIAVGISALLPNEALRAKIASYTGNGIVPFPGGQFLEYSVIHDNAKTYFEACVIAGFPCIEVSDNLLEIEVRSARRRAWAPPEIWPKMRPGASIPELNGSFSKPRIFFPARSMRKPCNALSIGAEPIP
jgi:phosphosulfolactate synthase (CoM biosynthesis protein A)